MWQKSFSKRNVGIDAFAIYMSSVKVLRMFIVGGTIWNVSLYYDNVIESDMLLSLLQKKK